ncbi:MAG: hypothetical protein IPP77_09710 [Bacteroidetes bacterium]|nr:hypothetical protein [Bacteroidota bacterium]
MKKIFFKAAVALIITGGVFTSCDSKEKKVEAAKEEVQDAKANLNEAQKELNAEYPAFKIEAEARIADNEKQISMLNEKLNKPGKAPLDGLRKKRIEDLEQRNMELRNRLANYENERSDWEVFKREFKHDMDGIGDAFKDLGKDNKN